MDWENQLCDRFLKLRDSLPQYLFSLYLVNDGSQSGILDEHIAHLKANVSDFHYLYNATNSGKGHALRNAIAHTKQDYVVYTDIDMPFTNASMVSIINELQNYDLVFGIKEKSYYEQLPFRRKLVSKILQKTIKFFFPLLPVSDTQCGLKGMNKRGKEVFLNTKINRYLFDLEFILYCAKAHLSIKPVPVTLRPGIIFGKMNNNILWQESKNLWRILREK